MEGLVTDKSSPLVMEALSRAAAGGAGLPLHGTKAAPGLFATSAAAKQAAQKSKDDGLLRVVRTETRGKTTTEICAITEKGLAYLLSQSSPRQVLEDLVRALDARHAEIGQVVEAARQTQAGFESLKAAAERILQQVGKPSPPPGPVAGVNGSDTWIPAALAVLARWEAAARSEDCPLPELYCQSLATAPGLSVGHFHDGIRRLHESGRIYLHPWTGPLYEIPEPAYALLVGHDIAYYVSLRHA